MQYLTGFDEIRSGLRWASPHLDELHRLTGLWRGAPRSAPSWFEGYLREGGQWVQLDTFSTIVSFWTDSLWSRLPSPVSEDVVAAMSIGSQWRSVTGIGVVAQEADGRLRSIPTTNWVPVRDARTSDRLGDVIGWPWLSERDPNREGELPDRIDLVLVGGDVNTRQTWSLGSGFQLDQLLSEEPAGVQQVVSWGDGRSDLKGVEPLILQLELRINAVARFADHHQDAPLMQGGRLGPYRGPNAEAIQGWVDGKLDDLITRRLDGMGLAYMERESNDTPPFEYVQPPRTLAESLAVMNFLVDQISMQTAIPTGSLGTNDQAQQSGGDSRQSGVSRERQLFRAANRLRRLRLECEPAIEALTGVADVSWPAAVFDDFATLVPAAINLVGAGLMDRAGAADLLGIAVATQTGQ